MRSFLRFFQLNLHNDHRFFRAMLRKNLTIALMAVLISIPMTVYSCTTIISREMESVRSAAVNTIEEITGELNMIRNMTAAIFENENVTKLRQMQPLSSSTDYLIAGKAQQFVGRLAASQDCIEEILVCFGSSDCILSSECVFSPASEMSVIYDFDIAPGLIQGGWTSNKPHFLLPCSDLTRYSYSVWPRSEVISPVSFCYCIPATRPRSASFYILLKSSYITDLFPQFIRDQGNVRLTNSAGDALYECGVAENPSILRLGLSHKYVDSTGTLHLELFFPISGILSLIREVLVIFVLTTLTALIVPIVLAYRMTLRQYAPVIEIMEKMDKCGIDIQNAQSKDAFVAECINVLTNARSEALAKLDSLNETLSRNTTLLLLNGATHIHPEWTKNIPERYVVVYGCMDIHDDQEQINDSLLSTVALERVIQRLHAGTTLHHLSSDSFAFVYPVTGDRTDELTDVLNRLNSSLDTQHSGSLRLSVSRPASGPENVYLMLEQARTAMLQSSGVSTLVVADEEDNHPIMRFQNVVSFYQALVAGDYDQSIRSIRQMTTMDMLSRYGLRDLYEYLSNMLCFAARDSGCQSFTRPKPYGVDMAPSQVLESLEQGVRSICDYRAEQKAGQVCVQRQEMIEFIRENLGKYDLSVKDIAERFRMSDRAVQAAISSEAGTTLANYLRSERMNRASRLLLETDMQVSAICDAVGYNTISAFHKAFKRTFGVAPGEYREQSAVRNESEGVAEAAENA